MDENTFGTYLEVFQSRQGKAQTEEDREMFSALEQACRIEDGDHGRKLNQAIAHNKAVLQAIPKTEWAHYYLGIGYLQQGNFQTALSHLEQARQLDPARITTFYYLAIAGKELNQIGKAKEALEKTLQLDRDFTVARQLLADLLYQEGAFNEAIPHYRAVLQLDHRNVTARCSLGQSLFNLEAYEQAVTELEPIAAQSQDGLLYLARSRARLGDFEAAIASFQQFIDTFGPHAGAFYYLGCAQANTGLAGQPNGYEQALAAFEQCLEVNPEYWQAHLQAGHIHLKLEHFPEARGSYLQAQAFQPQNPAVLSSLAKVACLTGNVEQAQKLLEQALHQSPDYTPAHLLLGVLYEQQKNTRQALEAYRQAGAHTRAGILYCQQGDYAQALDNLLKAQQAGDESDMLLSYLGFALAQNKQYQAALQTWKKLQANHPKDKDLALNIGCIYYLLGCEQAQAGRYAEAAQSWETYLNTHPDDEQARQNLVNVFARMGQVALQNQGSHNSQSRWAFQRAFELGGKNSIAEYYLALSELADQDYAGAAGRLRRLLAAAPEHTGYAYHLGLALLNQNRLDEAQPLLEQVLAKAGNGELAFKARAALAGLNARQEKWQAAADLLAELV